MVCGWYLGWFVWLATEYIYSQASPIGYVLYSFPWRNFSTTASLFRMEMIGFNHFWKTDDHHFFSYGQMQITGIIKWSSVLEISVRFSSMWSIDISARPMREFFMVLLDLIFNTHRFAAFSESENQSFLRCKQKYCKRFPPQFSKCHILSYKK